MILPIYAFGHKVLKQVAEPIDSSYPDLDKLIANMWETMYNASGVGLAAPQVGLSARIFLVDTIQLEQKGEDFKGIKQVFINPEIVDSSEDEWAYEEGCLSIPKIRGDVIRPESCTIQFFDASFEKHTLTFDDLNARVIQHEYDHLEGRLFTEQLKPVRRRLIRRKLEAIKKGQIEADYPIRFK
ncbi:MAG: peptide deformylase [Saprospiraceae bacterium]|nr:peptide deformylase [Saprospiraceae bacterium]